MPSLPHPKAIFLAPTVNEKGATMAEQIEEVVSRSLAPLHEAQRDMAHRVEEHAAHVEMLHDKLNAAHARVETLESRWHERLARYFRRGGR